MSNQKVHCPNLNHGRLVVAVKHCPTCGVKLSDNSFGKCNEVYHASQRKMRNVFCCHCGKKLSA